MDAPLLGTFFIYSANLTYCINKYITNILKVVHADDINDRTHNSGGVVSDTFQKRFEPVNVTLAV